MKVRLKGAVVVVTGASSGIGRAAALEFARRGSAVVLAARRERPLAEAAQQIIASGGRAIAHPTDVTDEGAVRELARAAVNAYGHVDVWVNNAAVAAFGKFDEIPSDVFRRVVDTVLMGTVHGSRAALAQFARRGKGVLINVASILGKTPVPYLTAYNAAKYAVAGFTETLRQEAPKGIEVCMVMPPPTDTPFYAHAANYTGRVPRPPPPVYDADTVAHAIVSCAERPRREVDVGLTVKAQRFVRALAPAPFIRLAAPFVERAMFEERPAPHTAGAVFEPMREGTSIDGGWKARDAEREREEEERRGAPGPGRA